ncbi:hypothetical protein SASPL_142958 [Salvia splendens]|uniref:Cation/H+ exchanger transmembrane domain-containing protein n=1 Tax=Salvia splendens TaxID=180675 RepID=A0A8X8WL95_SALSN|nr:hypothetical protein SASPL_142958 [Salvia splendens]
MASMSACGTASLRLTVLEEDSASEVLFVGISLVLGIACRQALGGTRVPYTVALLVLGIARLRLGKIGDGIRLWANIHPELLLVVFLPALLFESSFSMEVHQIKVCRNSSLFCIFAFL